jgi:tetratricopeptide (TPR) repeat protein
MQNMDEKEHTRTHSLNQPLASRVTDLLQGFAVVTDYTCKAHPNRIATAACEACGADLCAECSFIRGRRLLCERCLGTVGKALGGRGASSLITALLTHPLFVALALSVLLGIVFVNFGASRRRGLLGGAPENAIAAEEQTRLKILLHVQKADRIETFADLLRDRDRLIEANRQYARSKEVYELLMREITDRWESNLLTLVRARILEKMGEADYAAGLYESLANQPGEDKTYPAIAEYHLARLQEAHNPEKAVETYSKFLKDFTFVPDNLTRALKVMGSSEGSYNYKSRLQRHTRTAFNYKKAEVEALLRLGRLLSSLGRAGEARYRFSLAADLGRGTDLGDQASEELEKLRAASAPAEPESKEEPVTEELVITHF